MNTKSLIPGMASYMEDTSVEVEVNVDAAEVEEQVAEATEEVAEVTEADAEVQEEVAEAEMIFAQFDRIERLQAHVAKYGVDRTFLSLVNHDGSLTRALRVTVPSCESFDAVGDPYSSLSIAAQEGFGDAMKAVWEFIKKVCKKIWGFITRMWDAVAVRVQNIYSAIGRLRNLVKERTFDKELASKCEKEVMGPNHAAAKKKVDDLQKFVKDFAVEMAAAATSDMAVLEKSAADITAAQEKMKSKELEKKNEDLKKAKDEAKKAIDEIKEEKISKIVKGEADVTSYLDKATECCKECNALENAIKAFKAGVEVIEKTAKRFEAMAGDDKAQRKVSKEVRNLTSEMNKTAGVLSFTLSMGEKMARKYVNSASAIVSNCYKSK